ncbi:hypothetical protein HKX48_004820 [Thoreauomyces humboldtii]|nr:hypothetical protein HKX48_004820 [Thoreauomyces humboldtii]
MSTPWNGSKVCSPEPEPRHETAPSPRTILVPKPVRQQRQQSTSTARRRRHNPDAFVELMQKILSEPPEKGHETLSHALDQLAVKLADLGMTDRCVAFIRSEREREKGVHARQWFETHEPDQTAKHARMMGRRFGAMDEDEESGNMDDGDWEPDDLVHGSHFESIFGV